MIRYWFEFDLENHDDFPPGIKMGCGVTAVSLDDAYQILQQKVFKNLNLPKIKKQIENIDISLLDDKHVTTNIGVPSERGVWFPTGY